MKAAPTPRYIFSFWLRALSHLRGGMRRTGGQAVPLPHPGSPSGHIRRSGHEAAAEHAPGDRQHRIIFAFAAIAVVAAPWLLLLGAAVVGGGRVAPEGRTARRPAAKPARRPAKAPWGRSKAARLLRVFLLIHG